MKVTTDLPVIPVSKLADEKGHTIYGVQSIERALAIMEKIANAEPGELGVKELSDDLELSRSAVYRLLSVLKRHRYVRRLPHGRGYTLGLQITLLSALAAGTWRQDLLDKARPVLKRLAEQSGESTNLVEPLGPRALTGAIYVDQIVSSKSVHMLARNGQHAPLYCTAAGKVLLAYQSKEDKEYYLANVQLERRTDNTIVNRNELRIELRKIAHDGYALDKGELEPDVFCVAAPIFDGSGRVRGAISISGPSWRFGERQLEPAKDMLLHEAQALSRRLGN